MLHTSELVVSSGHSHAFYVVFVPLDTKQKTPLFSLLVVSPPSLINVDIYGFTCPALWEMWSYMLRALLTLEKYDTTNYDLC